MPHTRHRHQSLGVANRQTQRPNLPVFVYGTLLTGQPHAGLLAGRTTEVVPAAACGLRLFCANDFPVVGPSTDREDLVVGQLVTLSGDESLYADTLGRLDRLEGFHGPGAPGNVFDRVAAEVWLSQPGRHVEAWVYLGGACADCLATRIPRIESGDWLAHRGTEPRHLCVVPPQL